MYFKFQVNIIYKKKYKINADYYTKLINERYIKLRENIAIRYDQRAEHSKNKI